MLYGGILFKIAKKILIIVQAGSEPACTVIRSADRKHATQYRSRNGFPLRPGNQIF
jgi:hypothetical protein